MDIAEIRKKAKALKDMAEEPGAVLKEPPSARPAMPTEEVEEALAPEPAVGKIQVSHRPTGEHEKQPHPHPFDSAQGRLSPLPEEEETALLPPLRGEGWGGEGVFSEQEPAEGKALEAAEAEIEAITFMLDNEEYAIDIHQVKEIIKTREMTEVPRAPEDIVGVISLRGVVVPVMNLRVRLGMPMKEGGERIVIVKDGPDLLGILADSVKQVVRISESGIEPPPAVNTIDGEFIRGIGRCKGGMFVLLDIEKILERM